VYTRNLPTHLVRALGPSRLAAGALVTLALLSAAACSNDAASGITSPPLSMSKSTPPPPPPKPPKAPKLSGAMLKFAVLANQAVTCSTEGVITGDVGTFQATPTGVVTPGDCTITGATHVGDKTAIKAYNDFLKAYAKLTPQSGDVCTTLTPATQTLPPGVYCTVAGLTFTGMTLTLDGPSNGIWIFKIGTSGTGALTGTNFVVTMAGTALACNVTWWVAQGATMTDSNLKGNVLAGAAVSLTGGTFDGSAFAQADATVTGPGTVTAHSGKCK
jgi:Ice-binding-like